MAWYGGQGGGWRLQPRLAQRAPGSRRAGFLGQAVPDGEAAAFVTRRPFAHPHRPWHRGAVPEHLSRTPPTRSVRRARTGAAGVTGDRWRCWMPRRTRTASRRGGPPWPPGLRGYGVTPQPCHAGGHGGPPLPHHRNDGPRLHQRCSPIVGRLNPPLGDLSPELGDRGAHAALRGTLDPPRGVRRVAAHRGVESRRHPPGSTEKNNNAKRNLLLSTRIPAPNAENAPSPPPNRPYSNVQKRAIPAAKHPHQRDRRGSSLTSAAAHRRTLPPVTGGGRSQGQGRCGRITRHGSLPGADRSSTDRT